MVTVNFWFIILVATAAYWFGYLMSYFVHRSRPFGKVVIEKSLDPEVNDLVAFQLAGEIEDLYSMKRMTLLVETKEGRSKNNSDNDDKN